jgi:hypothetical protein
MPDETPTGGSALLERAANAANAVKKYSFNLYQSDVTMLRELVRWGVAANVTQALRSAIATEHFFRSAILKGEHVFLESPEGARREIVFLGSAAARSNTPPLATARQ